MATTSIRASIRCATRESISLSHGSVDRPAHQRCTLMRLKIVCMFFCAFKGFYIVHHSFSLLCGSCTGDVSIADMESPANERASTPIRHTIYRAPHSEFVKVFKHFYNSVFCRRHRYLISACQFYPIDSGQLLRIFSSLAAAFVFLCLQAPFQACFVRRRWIKKSDFGTRIVCA